MCRGQPRPYPEGARPSAPAFSGFRSIYAHIVRRRTTKFDVKNGEAAYSYGQPATQGDGRHSPRAPQFWGSPLFMPIPSDSERPN